MTETDSTAIKTVLLVEDDDVVRNLTTEVLQEFGYRVHALHDGASALELLRGDEHFDLLMSDIGLPGMDGASAGRSRSPVAADPAGVVRQADTTERELLDEVRARDTAAATDSIVKPYDFKLLASRLSGIGGRLASRLLQVGCAVRTGNNAALPVRPLRRRPADSAPTDEQRFRHQVGRRAWRAGISSGKRQ